MKKAQGSAGQHQARRALAETYDLLASLFTGILMQVQAVSALPLESSEVRNECLQRAEELARRGLRQVRELVEMKAVDHGGELATLKLMRALVKSTALASSMTGTFETKGVIRPLKSAVAQTLEGILQEALINTQRYADAKSIEVLFCFNVDNVVLEISDDGNGFMLDESLDLGSGLSEMRARADQLGGGFSLHGSPGKGTKIHVDLPNPYVDA